MFNKELIDEIYEHAEKAFPEEACGVLISDNGVDTFIPCNNLSDTPQKTFIISPTDYANAADIGEIKSIIHSHTAESSKPSYGDKVSCNTSGIPWLIVALPDKSETLFYPEGEKTAPLEGRTFCHGIHDCWTLIVDYYKETLDIEIPNIIRQDNWWFKGQNLYVDKAEEVGFNILLNEKPKLHDIIVMQVGADVPNHGAVYLGNNAMLHHLDIHKSERVVYGGFWEKNTWAILRHKSLMQ